MADASIIKLAQKAIKGNRKSFEALCESKSRELLFHAVAIVGNLHDAEDAVQETILTMYTSIDQLQAPEAVDVWIYRILKSKCMRLIDKRAKGIQDLDVDDDTIAVMDLDTAFIPEKYLEDKELGANLYHIVMGLPPKRREVIFLYYYEDLSVKEIAAITGQTANTVTSTIAKARMMIKEQLEKPEDQMIIGLGLASPALSGVLKQQALVQIPDPVLNAFHQKWTADLVAAKYPVQHAVYKGLVAVIVVAVGIVSVATAAYYYRPVYTEPAATTTVTVENAQVFDVPAKIDFLGGDCECGHTNPDEAIIQDAIFDTEGIHIIWTIQPAGSAQIRYEGEGGQVTDAFAEMKAAAAPGDYILTFDITDSNNNLVKKTRQFTIL
ncbi:hypothetical protein AGMMS49983_07830 [Clostridia bacterium]|nr:hypothetical protein AGMMS49983_07830 [Clostridia bacterium]